MLLGLINVYVTLLEDQIVSKSYYFLDISIIHKQRDDK